MEKVCCRCKVSKSLVDFAAKNKSQGTYQAYCKECKKLYNKTWYAKEQNRSGQITRAVANKKKYALEVMEWKAAYVAEMGGCSYQGCDVVNPIMIDFDHLDRDQKQDAVGNMVRLGYTLEKIKQEAAKCRLLCANHHRLWTAEQMGWAAFASVV